MAFLYITEGELLADTSGGQLLPALDYTAHIVEQPRLVIGASSTRSLAFSPYTAYIMISTDSACSIAIGANPTADVTLHRYAANERAFIGVHPGWFIAVIANI